MSDEDLIALANSHGAKWPDSSECELTRGELLSLLRAVQAAERESIKARLLGMDDAAAGRHNYYAHAAWVLFDRKA